ncbi:MAG: hypothetical protein J2O48_00930 [Solirubrobacterales bacterium]|nr:hypothetical protein [Solirubrobacterales bacterium]
MAQTKKKRKTKHRGNAAGMVETRGRTSRPPSPEEKKRQERTQNRTERMNRPPSWKRAGTTSGIMAVFILIFLILTQKPKHGTVIPEAVIVAVLAFAVYTPASYYLDKYMYNRRQKQLAKPRR